MRWSMIMTAESAPTPAGHLPDLNKPPQPLNSKINQYHHRQLHVSHCHQLLQSASHLLQSDSTQQRSINVPAPAHVVCEHDMASCASMWSAPSYWCTLKLTVIMCDDDSMFRNNLHIVWEMYAIWEFVAELYMLVRNDVFGFVSVISTTKETCYIRGSVNKAAHQPDDDHCEQSTNKTVKQYALECTRV